MHMNEEVDETPTISFIFEFMGATLPLLTETHYCHNRPFDYKHW